MVDEPGVTRDRLYGRSFWGDKEFIVVDTGGVVTISKSQNDVVEELAISTTIGMEGIPLASREAAVARMPSMIERQATLAVEESSVILFLVDGQVYSVTGINSHVEKLLSAFPLLVQERNFICKHAKLKIEKEFCKGLFHSLTSF